MEPGVVVGVVVIGIVHGVLPDHGWPIAATYALNRSRTWFYGTVAGLILGVGHLVSSVALVAAYYWFSGFASFVEGPWLTHLAGALLVLLGVREYRTGGHGHHHERSETNERNHDRGRHDREDNEHHDHDHRHHRHDHDHRHEAHSRTDDPESRRSAGTSARSRLRDRIGGRGHRHLEETHGERGLFALGATALLLGFAHEEPIQILAICVGTPFCLELMLVYSAAVIVAILVPTLLLIAGYERHRETVEAYTPHLPLVTAVVLVGMGLAFIVGIF